MEYNQLGKSDLRVSEVSFGCMSLGTDAGEGARLLHQALDRGINLFDTSDLYDKGQNEIIVGRAFAGMRGRVIVATKVGNQWRPDGSGWDWNPRKEYILGAVEGSLKRLRTDYIDLYQLHGGTLDDPIDETIEAFEQLRQQGKIRYYGISSIRPNVIREWISRSGLVSVMMQHSLLDRRPEETCLDLLHEHQISVLARGSLAQGLLVNKPAAPFLNYSAEDVQKAAAAIQAVSSSERDATATAIRYALHHPAVATAVVGMRTAGQLEEGLRVGSTPVLSDAEITQLRAVLSANQYEDHR